MATGNAQLSSTTGGLVNSIRDHLAKETLAIAQKNVRFMQLGEKLALGGGNGKTWTATRYNRVTLPSVSLTEGTTPEGSSLTTTQVTGTAEQWGQYITLTDVGLLVLYHPALVKSNNLLGKAAAELGDRETQVVLEGATSINYASNTATSGRWEITTGTGYLNTTEALKAVSELRDDGAEEYDGQNYVGVIDSYVEGDIILDTTFLNAAQYSNIVALYQGEVGTWMSVRWLRSNHVRKYYGAGLQVAVSGGTGSLTAGSTYNVVCVGYDTNRLRMSISRMSTGEVMTADGMFTVTVPDSPSGYLWDIYIGRTGSGAFLNGTHTGITGGESKNVSGEGSGAAAPAAPATGKWVHNAWIFGKGAFGVIDLTGIERYVTPAGPSDSDPLAQRRKTGFKMFFKAVILNNDFMKKIECYSSLN